MTEFKFSLDANRLRKEIELDFQKKTSSALSTQMNFIFKEPRSWIQDDKGGPAYELIASKITDYFLSDDVQKQIDLYIEQNFQRVLEEAAEKAMQKAALHHANRIAFKNIGERHKSNDQQTKT